MYLTYTLEGFKMNKENTGNRTVYTYTAEDALRDGIYVDLTEHAKDYYKTSVYCTDNLFNRHLSDDDGNPKAKKIKQMVRSFALAAVCNSQEEHLIELSINLGENNLKLFVKVWMTVEADGKGNPFVLFLLPEDY